MDRQRDFFSTASLAMSSTISRSTKANVLLGTWGHPLQNKVVTDILRSRQRAFGELGILTLRTTPQGPGPPLEKIKAFGILTRMEWQKDG